jgi:hypothetical protein
MRRALKWTGATVLVIATLIAVVLLILDWNMLRGPLAARVSQETGRDFAIEGDLTGSLSWTPWIRARNVRFANAEWASEADMVRIEELGLPAAELRTVGGGARSELWCQIKADVTRRRVWVPAVTETTALGAAMLAGAAVGAWALEEATGRLVREARVHEPSRERVEIYADRYGVYRDLYERLTPVFRRAARLE